MMSQLVREGLIKFLLSVPEEGREFLLGLSQGEDYLAKHAQNMIQKLGWIDGAGDFYNLSVLCVMNWKLGGFYWIVLFIQILKLLLILFSDKLADRCRDLLLQPSSSRMICEVINRVYFTNIVPEARKL